jgi:pilus assembly protein Flp/PilA
LIGFLNCPKIKALQGNMPMIAVLSSLIRVWKDRRGQNLLEYALMGGFLAVAAGALMPQVSGSIGTIFGHVSSVMTAAASECTRRPTPTSR